MYKNCLYESCSTCYYSMNCPRSDFSSYGYYDNYPMIYRMDDPEQDEFERTALPVKKPMYQQMPKQEPMKYEQPQQKQMPVKQVIPQPKQEQMITPYKEQNVDINIQPKIEPQYMELTIQPKLQTTKMELDIEPKMEPSNMELNIEPKMGSIIVAPIKLELIIEPKMEPTKMQLNIQPMMEPIMQTPNMMIPEMLHIPICPMTQSPCHKMKHSNHSKKHSCHNINEPYYKVGEQEDIQYQFIHPYGKMHQKSKHHSDCHLEMESDEDEFMDN